MKAEDIDTNYGMLTKLNVTDVDASLKFYTETLGMTNDEKIYVPGVWAQVSFGSNVIGLNRGKETGSGHASITFYVKDIKAVRDSLIEKGVEVSDTISAGKGVTLAFFKDPDGNGLGLRENS